MQAESADAVALVSPVLLCHLEEDWTHVPPALIPWTEPPLPLRLTRFLIIGSVKCLTREFFELHGISHCVNCVGQGYAEHRFADDYAPFCQNHMTLCPNRREDPMKLK